MKTNRVLVAALVLAFAPLGLSGCSEITIPNPLAAEAEIQPALTPERVESIDAKVFEAIKAGDASLNADDLGSRVIGPAHVDRRFAYQKKSLLGDGNELPALSTKVLQTAVSSDNVYPHIMMQIMEAPEGQNLQSINILLQTAARANWGLWTSMQMHPGATMPAINTGEEGATIIGQDDTEGFVASPAAALDAYVKLASTRNDSNGLKFDADPLLERLHKGQDQNAESVKEIGEATQTFARGPEGPYALRTADGGIIVVGQINWDMQIHVTKEGGSATIPANHDIAIAATGKANEPVKITDTMIAHYTGAVLLNVPAADAEDQTIHVVASTPGTLTSVENKTGEE